MKGVQTIWTKWMDRIIKEQGAIIDKAQTTAEAKIILKDTLGGLFSHNCPICHLDGHEASACWVNQQMFKTTRSKPVLKLAWWSVKQIAKQDHEDAQDKLFEDAKKHVKRRKREAKREGKALSLGFTFDP